MGRVTYIEVKNFKSYHGTHTVGPLSDFTCVIGPNGSGKSNLVDAITFALGLASSHLRSERLKDLIFHVPGTAADEVEAYVEITYQPGEGETDDDREVKFKRILNGEGNSTYKIQIGNDKYRTVSYDAYNKRLVSYNILVKPRNFVILQDEVMRLSSMGPRELTKFFETISGSDEYKREYERLKQEKEQAEENTIFNFQKKKAITGEKRQYKQQKEEAEKFSELSQKREQLRLNYALWRLFCMDDQLAKASETAETERATLEDKESVVANVADIVKGHKQEMAKANKASIRLQKQLTDAQRKSDKKKPQSIQVREQISHHTKKLKSAKALLAKNEALYTKHLNEIADMESELDEVKASQADFESHASESNPELKLLDDQLTEYNTLKGEAAREVSTEQAKLAKLELDDKTDQGIISAKEGTLKDVETRAQSLEEKITQTSSREKDVNDYITRTTNSLDEMNQQLADLETEEKEKEVKLKDINSELGEVTEQLRFAKADRAENKRETKFQETVETLKKHYPGVRGTLLELCKPVSRKYNVAVSTVMGKHMDAIVVDDEKTAMECIAHVREARACVATFLPLDTIRVKPVAESHRQLGGETKLVLDVLQFDPAITRAVQYAVGNTIVTANLDIARKLCFRGTSGSKYKAVTLDGNVILKSGLMTGGGKGNSKGANRWDQQQVSKLKKQKATLDKRQAELLRGRSTTQKRESLRTKISGTTNRIAYSKKEADTLREQISESKTALGKLKAEIKTLAPAIAKLKSACDKRGEEISTLKRKIHKAEDKIFAKFSQSVGVSNIREYEATRLRQATERAEKRVEFADRISKLENQLEYERSRETKLQESVAKVSTQIGTDEAALTELNARDAELAAAFSADQKAMDALREEIAEAKRAIADIEVTVKEQTKIRDAKNRDLNQTRKRLAEAETEAEAIRGRRAQLIQTCKVENVEIPFVEQADEDGAGPARKKSKTNGKRRRGRGDSDEMDVEDEETPGSPGADDGADGAQAGEKRGRDEVIDYSSLPRALQSADQDVDRVGADFKSKIDTVQTEMEKLDPNMKAISRFDDVQNRLNEVNDEFLEARNSAKDVTEQFLEIKRKRHAKFTAAFNHIAGVIDKVYKELTKSKSHPTGGTAYLTLENPDEPYLGGVKYNAMPPLKRFRDMDSLSGGEQTMCTIALMMAIHSYQPPPFFLMDEIDAFLDPINTSKVTNYLMAKSKQTQFIVVSLRDAFFEKADALIGVYRDAQTKVSGNLVWNLQQYAVA